MEYNEDQWYWYMCSYGYELNKKLACKVVKDMVWTMDNAEISGVKASFLFSRGQTLLNLFTALQMFQDKELNYTDDKRKFRLGAISPFAANLGFGLYNCQGKQKLQMFHNEKAHPIPLCNDEYGNCEWNEFKKNYSNLINNCRYEEFCKV